MVISLVILLSASAQHFVVIGLVVMRNASAQHFVVISLVVMRCLPSGIPHSQRKR